MGEDLGFPLAQGALIPGAMVTFSIYGGDYYRGICSTMGNVFFKIIVSRVGIFITLCVLAIP